MNILIAVSNMTYANGGVNTHVIDLCNGLIKNDINVILVTNKNKCDFNNQIEQMNLSSNFKFYSVDMDGIQKNPGKLLKVTKKFSRIVKNERIDIIHTHSQMLCIVGQLIKIVYKIPYIWTNHIDEMASPKFFKIIMSFFRFPIISVSSDLKNMLVDSFNVSKDKISVVPNGIDLGNFKSITNVEKENIIKKYNCSDKYVVGILARLTYGKGHMYLLEAVNKIQSKHKIGDIKVIIAGKDYGNGYLDELMAYAKENNINLEYVGYQNPRYFFSICDISILPSIYEGFGLTVLESLAMGCPVIRSDTPGWTDTKDISFVFKKRNINQLANYLYYAYSNRDEMTEKGMSGKKVVFDKYSIESQINNTISVYNKIMGRI